jgi:hypothetical protein
MTNTQFNVRLPGNTLECIDLLVETYGMTKTQVIILAVDRLTRDLYPDGKSDHERAARTEAKILADTKDESGEVEQVG